MFLIYLNDLFLVDDNLLDNRYSPFYGNEKLIFHSARIIINLPGGYWIYVFLRVHFNI